MHHACDWCLLPSQVLCCPAAALQAAGDEVSITSVMAAASAATREAAAAVAWAWLRGYELAVAAQQEWPGPGPREGDSDLETHLLVQELMAHGVSEVRQRRRGLQGNISTLRSGTWYTAWQRSGRCCCVVLVRTATGASATAWPRVQHGQCALLGVVSAHAGASEAWPVAIVSRWRC